MLRKLFLAAAAVATLAACATATPYQPAIDSRYGYSEIPIEADRYRVMFTGNSLTERETVENYLLLRAAELSLAEGYDAFRVVTRDTEANRRYSGTSYGGPYAGYSPWTRFSYYNPYYGWYGFHDPFYNDVSLREVTRYEASAEILFGAGNDPDAPNVFDARDVVANLSGLARPPIR